MILDSRKTSTAADVPPARGKKDEDGVPTGPPPAEAQYEESVRQHEPAPAQRAGPWRVAVIILSGLFMIGRRRTWEEGGARVTPLQIVVGALIGAVLLIAALLTLVRVIIRLAGA